MRKILLSAIFIFFYFNCYAEQNIYSIYMMGTKIGSSTDKWTEMKGPSGNCILTLNSSSEMEINRGEFSIRLKSSSIVRADCKTFIPVDIRSESSEISSTLKATGTNINGTFKAEIEKNGNIETFSYPLKDDITFFSLILKKISSEKLIKGGTAKVISEDSLSVKEISYSGVQTPSGSTRVTVNYSGVPIVFEILKGTIVKSELQNGLISYVLDGYDIGSEKSASVPSNNRTDIIESTAIENSGVSVKKPRNTVKVMFSFSGKNSTEIPDIPKSCFQKVSTEKGSATVTVTSDLCKGDNPGKQDTLPNLYEDSNNRNILETARKVAEGAPDSNEMIKRMVRFVFKHIKDKNYKFGNLSASEVLAKKAGDCTEHSTLLAALLKSLNIPVKMAYGIVLDDQGRFFFHNWNVAFNGTSWIPVDSTFGMEKADSSRVVLIFGDGSSQSREDVSLTVLKFMSTIGIAVTGFEYEK